MQQQTGFKQRLQLLSKSHYCWSQWNTCILKKSAQKCHHCFAVTECHILVNDLQYYYYSSSIKIWQYFWCFFLHSLFSTETQIPPCSSSPSFTCRLLFLLPHEGRWSDLHSFASLCWLSSQVDLGVGVIMTPVLCMALVEFTVRAHYQWITIGP